MTNTEEREETTATEAILRTGLELAEKRETLEEFREHSKKIIKKTAHTLNGLSGRRSEGLVCSPPHVKEYSTSKRKKSSIHLETIKKMTIEKFKPIIEEIEKCGH